MHLLLDTNLWSRLADRGEQDSFHRFVKSAEVTVVVAPATLLEVLRTPDPNLRRRRVRLLCRSTWRRLPTEAQAESQEFVAEVKRLRPHWLWPKSDQYLIAELERFWSTGIWRAARDERPGLRVGAARPTALNEAVLREQRLQQARWREAGFLRSLEEVPRAIRDQRLFPDPSRVADAMAEGWRDGTTVEAWRVENLRVFWHALCVVNARARYTGEDTTYADWVGAFIDLDVACQHRADFGRMWLYEVETAHLGRCWLRWAVRFAQHASRVGPGNPVDEQYAAYLVDADVFATGDRRLARIVNVVNTEAPISCASAAFVHITPQTSSVTSAIASAITGAMTARRRTGVTGLT